MPHGWRAVMGILLAAQGFAPAQALASDSQDTSLPPAIEDIMAKPQYKNAAWGLLDIDPAGAPIYSRRADEMFMPGSTAKLFSVSAAWKLIGPNRRFTTPVYRLGRRRGTELQGDLVLVGAGDLSLGGRTTREGGIDYTDVDHSDAPLPGAALTPEDPLAGIKDLARQVRKTGIRRVRGDVVIDDRLFHAEFNPQPTPVMINDNLIDVVTKPTSAGRNAKVSYRPKAATLTVDAHVRTVAAGHPDGVTVTGEAPGRIRVTGTIAAGSERDLQIVPIADPAAFARTVFVQALRRAGVRVYAPTGGANPAAKLPRSRSYRGRPRVAAYISPSYADYAKMFLKVSHNLGTNLGVCLLAVRAGAKDCLAGFAPMKAFLAQAGVDVSQVALGDGRGGDPVDRITPTAMTQLLRYWITQPDFDAFRACLPILGVDGSLATTAVETPARGKVFAKTGTALAGDPLNELLFVEAKALAGYFRQPDGGWHVFNVVVNNAGGSPGYQNYEAFINAVHDLGNISALLWQQSNP